MQRITRVAALVLVAIAIVLAVVAFSLGRRAAKPASGLAATSRQSAAETAATPQGADVVVAAVELKEGMRVNATALRVVKRSQAPEGSFADIGALAGTVPRMDVPAGAIVTSALLVRGVATALKPGERALAVPVDEQTGVGNRVQPGDYVDVFMSLKPPPAASFGKRPVDRTQTRLLLSHLRVLAYGDQDLPAQPHVAGDAGAGEKPGNHPAQKGSSLTREGSPTVPRTAVLAVPVEDADQLLLGVQNGRLSLALRPAGDESRPDGSLFEKPHRVLATLADLTTGQQRALEQPENRAYAGIDGSGLAGQDATPTRSRQRPRHGTSQGLEIIRGSASSASRGARKDMP